MSDRLTPKQYLTLDFISKGTGETALLPMHWRDRHHQHLIQRGFLSLRSNPFTTNAHMLKGRITVRGTRALMAATDAVRRKAKALADREYEHYVSEDA